MAWPCITVHALTLCLETSVRRLSHYVELMKVVLEQLRTGPGQIVHSIQ
jgi:hypothetical protein